MIDSQVIPSALIHKHIVPDLMLNDLHNYSQEVLDEKKYHEKRIATPYLAADIFKQFFLNQEDPRVQRYVNWQNELAKEYITHYQEIAQITYPDCEIKTEDIWSVHSKEGDYNPIHSHNVETGYGLATVTWTELPPSMHTDNSEGAKTYDSYGLFKETEGVADGFLSLQSNIQKNIKELYNFNFSQQTLVKPQIGLMIMFPIWMNHLVYPFRGEGERRSIASNIVISIK
jgi:hypothetical protein